MQTAPLTAAPPLSPFAWEEHHFVAASPALDFANAVVYRLDRGRREDRFRSDADVNAWAAATGLATAPVTAADLDDAIAAREAIDAVFRPASSDRRAVAWQRLVRLYARYVTHLDDKPLPALVAVVLHEAVALRFSPWLVRVKACDGCGWLFIDRTRNGSKRWCISSLCGNRDKARRHYHRKKLAG